MLLIIYCFIALSIDRKTKQRVISRVLQDITMAPTSVAGHKVVKSQHPEYTLKVPTTRYADELDL